MCQAGGGGFGLQNQGGRFVVTCQPSATRKKANTAPPDEIKVCPFKIAVDTREQMPWTFQGIVLEQKQIIVQRQTITLQTGDYSITNRTTEIIIERKSVSDFLSSITHGNARFKREHQRMEGYYCDGGFACVIVEGDLAKICDELDDPSSERQIASSTVLGIAASWPRQYCVPWYFAGDRRRAELLAFRILWKWFGDNVK